MAWSCNLVVERVSLVRTSDSLGHTLLKLADHERIARDRNHPEMLKRLSLFGLGGLAADYCHWERSPKSKPDDIPKGHFDDQAKTLDFLRRLGHEGDLDAYIAMTVKWMNQPAIFLEVDGLAKELIAKVELQKEHLEKRASATPRITSDFLKKLNSVREQFSHQTNER